MKLIILALAAIPFAACTSSGMSPPPDEVGQTAMPADLTPTEAMPYVTMAGASDLYEIESSRLALEKTQDPDIRAFAQMMIDHHTRTTQQVTAAARAAGMTPPPPRLMPMQEEMMAELRPLSGEAFASAYLSQQQRAHEMALALHQTYAADGDTAALRTAAAGAVPIIEQHISSLRELSAN